MTRHVALFRAVNVGGRTKVAMADLRNMAAAIGLETPSTILQTGNLIFEADETGAALEKRIETAAVERLSLVSDVMVRTLDEWAALVANNPFNAEAKDDPAHLVLLALKGDPVAGAESALTAAIKGRERVRVVDRTAYAVFPDGIGRSKLTPQVLERHLGARATGRNWNTVVKIAAALSS